MTTAGGAQGGLVGREVQSSTWAPRFGMYQLETRNFPPLKTTSGSLIFSPSQTEAVLLAKRSPKPSAWSAWGLCFDTVHVTG